MAKLSNLEKKIKKALDDASKETAEELTFMIENAYEKAIDNFYNSYTPSWYNRTYSTYLASDKYNGIFNSIESTNDGYIAGIEVSASNIGGNPYRADLDWVFNRTFVEGIHGYTYNEYKTWRSSHEKKKDGYLIRIHWRKGMSKMKQPPKDYMDKWYRHEILTGRGQAKIDKIFTNAISKALS